MTDNSDSGRFSASSKWIKSDYSSQRYGANYRVLKRPSTEARAAWWKVDVPSKGFYDVYARWPSDPGYNPQATFRITTTDGVKTKVVNQRKNGGKWIKLGRYPLRGGDSYKVALSSTSGSGGFLIADAVRIAKPSTTTTDSSGGATGADIVSFARKQVGDRYVYGATGPDEFDCSGLTMYVYKQVANKSLPHSAKEQYNYGTSVSRSELKPGDLIFGNASGSGIQHVGIYAGKDSNGNRLMIHAGTPETDVEITTYESWYTVIGYKRLL